jgi:hypothetical protein
MKEITTPPCHLAIMDDDETPYVPLWRVLVNGKPHRDVLEEQNLQNKKETPAFPLTTRALQ